MHFHALFHWKGIYCDQTYLNVTAQDRADVKELFFWEVILHQFLKRKKWALLGKIVQAIFPLINLAQKVPFLEDLKKKVSESDWNQRHIVYVTQIHYYTWF